MTKYEPAATDGPDVFAVHRIDEQLTKALDRKVWLPSGGTLVIDRTEAMTVVDVNTGKFTGSGGNLEQTVTRNNLEAAEETVRQLRLRDIGGIIVIDFIDMVLESNRDLVLRRLTEALARDRTRHQVSEVTSLGLVQLTRKKLGTGLIEAFSTTCSALRRARNHAARRPCRHRGSDGGAGSPKPPAGRPRQARQEGAVGAEEVQVAKVPAHLPASTRCSRRWRRPTASMRTTTSDDVDDVDDADAAEGVAELERRRPSATPSSDGPDDEDDSDDEDYDDDDDSDDDDDDDDDSTMTTIDDDDPMTTMTTTPTTTRRRRLDDDDEDDDDEDDEDDDDRRSRRLGRLRRRFGRGRPVAVAATGGRQRGARPRTRRPARSTD